MEEDPKSPAKEEALVKKLDEVLEIDEVMKSDDESGEENNEDEDYAGAGDDKEQDENKIPVPD